MLGSVTLVGRDYVLSARAGLMDLVEHDLSQDMSLFVSSKWITSPAGLFQLRT